MMSRLVAMNSPLGSFLKFARNSKFVNLVVYIHPIAHAFIQIKDTIYENRFSSSNLVFLCLEFKL